MNPRILFIVLSGFWAVTLYAQSKRELTKKYKDTIVRLKETHNLRKVNIKVEEDGYWYFLLQDREKNLGVADSSGKIIIPVENEVVTYYPQEDKGEKINTVNYPMWDKTITYKYCYEKSAPVFLVKYGNFMYFDKNLKKRNGNYNKLVSTNGEIKADSIKWLLKIPGYWIAGSLQKIFLIDIPTGYTYMGANLGLYKTDGTRLVPEEYVSLTIGSKYDYMLDDDSRYQQCIYGYTKEKGGCALNGQAGNTPCIFNSIELKCSNGKYYWNVKRNKNDLFEIYNENEQYRKEYKDEGEKYFEHLNYDKVIEYYAKEGVDKPWAKFFTGAAFCEKGFVNSLNAWMFAQEVEKNNGMYTPKEGTYVFDLDLAVTLLENGKMILNAYLQEDTVYSKQAIKYIGQADNYITNIIPSNKKKYERALSLIEAGNEEKLKAQRELIESVVGLFQGVISSAGSQKNSVSKTNIPVINNAKGINTVSSADNEESAGVLSQGAPDKKKVKCITCKGKGFWVEERISGDKKWCDRCGEARKPHAHKTCGTCKGVGWTYK